MGHSHTTHSATVIIYTVYQDGRSPEKYMRYDSIRVRPQADGRTRDWRHGPRDERGAGSSEDSFELANGEPTRAEQNSSLHTARVVSLTLAGTTHHQAAHRAGVRCAFQQL